MNFSTVKTFFQRISQKQILSDTIVLSVSNLIVSALNYLFLIVCAELLSPLEFGVLGAAVSVLTLMTMLGNVVQMYVTPGIANSSNLDQAKLCASRFLKLTALYTVVPLVLVFVFAAQIGSLVNASSWDVTVLALSTIALITSSVANGLFSGLGKISFLAGISLISAISKFLIGALLVFIGFGTKGAIGAYLVGFIVTTFYIFSPRLKQDQDSQNDSSQIHAAQTDKKNLLLLTLVYILLVFPFVADQLMLQHLNPEIGGQYAALMILGKLVFFLASPILTVAYSHACIEKESTKQRKVFVASTLMLILLMFVVAVVWKLFGPLLGELLLPSKYHKLLEHVVVAGAGVCAYCLSYLVSLFALIRKKHFIIFFLLPALVIQVALFVSRHSSIEQATYNQLITYLCQLFLSLIFLLTTLRRSQLPD